MSEPGIAQRILAVIAGFRRKGTLESSLCWDAQELERLAMFAVGAKNDLARSTSPNVPRTGTPQEQAQIAEARAHAEYILSGPLANQPTMRTIAVTLNLLADSLEAHVFSRARGRVAPRHSGNP